MDQPGTAVRLCIVDLICGRLDRAAVGGHPLQLTRATSLCHGAPDPFRRGCGKGARARPALVCAQCTLVRWRGTCFRACRAGAPPLPRRIGDLRSTEPGISGAGVHIDTVRRVSERPCGARAAAAPHTCAPGVGTRLRQRPRAPRHAGTEPIPCVPLSALVTRRGAVQRRGLIPRLPVRLPAPGDRPRIGARISPRGTPAQPGRGRLSARAQRWCRAPGTGTPLDTVRWSVRRRRALIRGAGAAQRRAAVRPSLVRRRARRHPGGPWGTVGRGARHLQGPRPRTVGEGGGGDGPTSSCRGVGRALVDVRLRGAYGTRETRRGSKGPKGVQSGGVCGIPLGEREGVNAGGMRVGGGGGMNDMRPGHLQNSVHSCSLARRPLYSHIQSPAGHCASEYEYTVACGRVNMSVHLSLCE